MKQDKKFNFLRLCRLGIFISGVALTATFFISASFTYFYPPLPSEKEPILFYSNQLGHSLKTVTIKALEGAKKTLVLHSFSLTDKTIVGLLSKKAKQLSYHSIKTDLRPAPSFYTHFQTILDWQRLPCSGLAHEKILLIDDAFCYLGTANMTTESLTMHDNVILGFYSEPLVHFLKNYTSKDHPKKFKTSARESFSFLNQTLFLWMLPSKQSLALDDLLDEINQSKHSVSVSMFTLTHPKILSSLVEAKKRGVCVKIYLDQSSAKGASSKAAAYLLDHGIEIFISSGIQLLHHKMALIDESVFILGSANWTQSAFSKNRDFFLILKPLNVSQRLDVKKIFKHISKHAKKPKLHS